MPKGIIIFGSAGSGKTTLGKMVAKALSFPYFDIDDYIWKKDTAEPYTVMYSREEKANQLMEAISGDEHFVMAGSMDSFHAPFDPLFELAVHLTADKDIRLARVNQRAYEQFGYRILEGGDLFQNHRRFLDSVSRYDTDGSPNLKTHTEWANTLKCEVLRLNGANQLTNNCDLIVEVYNRKMSSET
ncbi:AAA family ATPase [Sedimentibacter sp. B4]|uniref:AAA family ATPase n=1 Tax=Sedimentibacter sp. B4 TaxID=304766 RepID=UPI0002F1B8E9|nr:AAA family ATPase [Sedimentibacter sp. B4]